MTAYIFFILIILGCVAWVAYLFVASPYTPTQTLVYFLSFVLNKFLWRVDHPKRLPHPPGQGAVLIANHRSSADPFFIQPAAKRVIKWLVAFNVKDKGFLSSFLKFVQIVPVSRSGRDTAAMKAAIKYAKAGHTVGILPEGRINMTEEFMMPIRPGAILIALKAKVPVVPMYIRGAPYGGSMLSPFLMRGHVTVKVGEPIDLSEYYGRSGDRESLLEATRLCVCGIAKLAGLENYNPEIAGAKWKPSEEELEALHQKLKTLDNPV